MNRIEDYNETLARATERYGADSPEVDRLTSAQRDEYRLTDGDEVTVIGTIGRLVRTAIEQSSTGHPAHDPEVLRRAAAHSIGCSLYDLRGSELAWIDRMVAEQIAAY